MALSKEHAYLSGDPGGAKTNISLDFLKSVLAGWPAEAKEIFIQQFNKLLNEGVITGFPKFKSFYKGHYKINRANTLAGANVFFALLEEVNNANVAAITATLSILNERKIFDGHEEVDLQLLSVVLTSNLSTTEFKQTYRDDPDTADALLDRIAIKYVVPDQLPKHSDITLIRRMQEQEHPTPLIVLSPLFELLEKVQIERNIYDDVAELIFALDASNLSRPNKERIASNQFSTRSALKIPRIMAARFLIAQMDEGIPFDELRFKIERRDLQHIQVATNFGAPGEIRLKREQFLIQPYFMGDQLISRIEVESSTGKIFLYTTTEHGRVMRTNKTYYYTAGDFADFKRSILKVMPGLSLEIFEQKKEALEYARLEFENDGLLDSFLSINTLSAGSRADFEVAQFERNSLVGALNALVAQKRTRPTEGGQKNRGVYTQTKVQELSLRKQNGEPNGEQAAYLDWQLFYAQLLQKFPNLENLIDSIMLAMLSKQHAFVFGPPGGAKSQVSLLILKVALASLNQEEKEEFYKIFVQQFHKMVPLGKIVGYDNLEALDEDGRREAFYQGSVADEGVVFFLLDEVEKSHPEVFPALLGVLNERVLMSGNGSSVRELEHFISAIMTSNKSPHEFEEGGKELEKARKALMSRTGPKVYVHNKLSTAQELATLMWQQADPNQKTDWSEQSFSLRPLHSMIDKISFYSLEGEITKGLTVENLYAEIIGYYIELRTEVSRISRTAHEESSVENPYVYHPAMYRDTRAQLRVMNSLGAAFLLWQLKQGIEFGDLRTEILPEDAPMLSMLLTYNPLAKFALETNSDSFPLIRLEAEYAKRLANSDTSTEEAKFMLDIAINEADELSLVINQKIRALLVKIRELHAEFPKLFPSLQLDLEALNNALDGIEQAKD